MLLYYITDRKLLGDNERQQRERLLEKIVQAARAGVDYIQLREKDLNARELESLAREAVRVIGASNGQTRLLINSRTDVALAAGAGGVHLTSNDISPAEVRTIWRNADGPGEPVIAVSCHGEAEVIAAEEAGASFAVFGPVFQKAGVADHPTGTAQLRAVCLHRIPVLALGGVTAENARQCTEAGAKGVAGIRIFQEGDLSARVNALRKL